MSFVGDNVTYICTVNSFTHSWRIPAYDVSVAITLQTDFSSLPPFTLRLVAYNNESITTSLSVISFSRLNGTQISCSDGVVLDGGIQETTIIVLGEF